MERRHRGWLQRGVALVTVFGMALYAFRAGVTVSDRANVANAPLLAHIYYAAGLFVLGGMDLGTPASGPPFAQALLWAAYFLAPIITTSAVLEAGLRIADSASLDRLGLRHHVVLVGLGRLATTFVQAARSWDPDCLLVALDRDIQRAAVRHVRRELGVRVFLGDALLPSSFAALRLGRARCVALLTDDDLLNLEVAYRLARDYPTLRVVAHVADIGLQRTAREVELPDARVSVFNAHRAAAEHLYTEHLHGYFAGTAARDAVVLAGFGRFGQAILELLERQAGDAVARVIVADENARASLRGFRDQFAAAGAFRVSVVSGDLGEPRTWDRISRRLGALEVAPVIIVGTQHDRVNLQGGLHARRRWPTAPTFVRCQSESAFTEALALQHQLSVLAVNTLLEAALIQSQRAWFDAPLADRLNQRAGCQGSLPARLRNSSSTVAVPGPPGR